MRIKKLLLLIVVMFTIPSVKGEWVIVSDESEKTETHYFDPKSTKKSGNYRKVWVLSSYDEEQIGGYHSVKSFYEFDCKEGRTRSYTMLLYSDKMAIGDVIGAQHDKLKEWSTYTSGSIFSRIANVICTN